MHILSCQPSLVAGFAWQRFSDVTFRLAPTESLPPAPEGYRGRGAVWLTRGLLGYVGALSRDAVGIRTLSETRSRRTASVRGMNQPLRNFETSAGVEAIGYSRADELAFLAADWLVQRAGERSVFNYYRLLPSSDSWEEAFEAAFGITIDDFYAAFAAHRREVAPPLPHLADDVDEPILVFEGEIPADTEARIRAEFEGVQALIRERFRGGPADYTVFVGSRRGVGRGCAPPCLAARNWKRAAAVRGSPTTM